MPLPHLVGAYASNNQQLAPQENHDTAWFLVHSINWFLCKIYNAFYWHNQNPWNVCLFEDWPHTELLGQPQGPFYLLKREAT